MSSNIVEHDPAVWLCELYLYWDYVHRNKVMLLKSRFVGKRPYKALNEVLLIGDPALEQQATEADASKLLTLRTLLQALNLLEIQDTKLQIKEKNLIMIPQFWMADGRSRETSPNLSLRLARDGSNV